MPPSLLHLVWMLICLIMLWSDGTSAQIPSDCPKVCTICINKLVLCAHGGLTKISPNSFPKFTENVTLIGHHNLQPQLNTDTLAGLENLILKYLAIRSSNIQEIQSGAFSRLRYLRIVDLSENLVLQIDDYAFQGIILDELKLDEIGNLKMFPKSFSGLSVRNLSINNAKLNLLDYTVFRELAETGHLKYLSLSQNMFHTIDRRFQTLFGNLRSLNLNENPLVCNCSLLWLKQLSSKIPTKNIQINFPKCVSPSRLRGKTLAEIQNSEIKCFAPRISEIHFSLIDNRRAQLLCRAVAERGSNGKVMVSWLQHQTPLTTHTSKAVIMITRKRYVKSVKYRCMAQNKVGKSIIKISFSWPPLIINNKNNYNNNYNRSIITTDFTPTDEEREDGSSIINNNNNKISLSTSYFYFKKRYTLIELIVAVITTFIGTILMFFLIYKLCILKTCSDHYNPRKFKTGSSSHTPMFSSSNNNNNHHHHEHQRINNNSHSEQQRTPVPFLNSASYDNNSLNLVGGESNSQTYDCISVNNTALFLPTGPPPVINANTMSRSKLNGGPQFIDYKTHERL